MLEQPQPRLLGLWPGCKLLGGFCTLHGLCGESLLLGLAVTSLQVDALPFKGDPAVLRDPCRTIIADPRLCNSSLLLLHLLVLEMVSCTSSSMAVIWVAVALVEQQQRRNV